MARKKVDTIVEEISVKYPQFDTQNYKNALFSIQGVKGEELTNLYLKKFYAIQSEEYEKASILKRKIIDIESHKN
jgi:hypothetical protein